METIAHVCDASRSCANSSRPPILCLTATSREVVSVLGLKTSCAYSPNNSTAHCSSRERFFQLPSSGRPTPAVLMPDVDVLRSDGLLGSQSIRFHAIFHSTIIPSPGEFAWPSSLQGVVCGNTKKGVFKPHHNIPAHKAGALLCPSYCTD